MVDTEAARTSPPRNSFTRPWMRGRAGAWLTLAAAMLLATILVLAWSGDRSLTIDEWPYFVDRSHWTLENILRPTGGHLLALGMVLYNAYFSVFGPESHLPLTLITVGFQILVGGLVFVYAERRIGSWLALIPAVLVLFLGAGWEILISSAVLPNQIAMAAGIAMLLALDRRDRPGDVLAFVALLASLASFSIGLAFAGAAALRIILERRERGLRRLVIVATPLVLYGAWLLWSQKYEQGNFSASNLGTMPSAIFDQINAGISAMTGLFRVTGRPSLGDALILDTTRTSALVWALGLAVVVRVIRGPRLDPAAWTTLALVAIYLLLVGIGLNEFRKPDASRYAYMFTVVFALAASDLLAGIRISRPWAIVATAAMAISLVGNVAQIRTAGSFFELESELNRAEAGALELARPYVAADFVAESGRGYGVSPYRDFIQPAGTYFAAVDRLGSPAYSPDEIASSSLQAQIAADEVLVSALGLEVGDAPPQPRSEIDATAQLAPLALNGVVAERRGCIRLTPVQPGGSYVSFNVPAPDGVAFYGSSPPALVQVGRFTESPDVKLPASASSGLIQVPTDGYPRPWRAALTYRGEMTICPLPAAADSP